MIYGTFEVYQSKFKRLVIYTQMGSEGNIGEANFLRLAMSGRFCK